MDTTGLPRFHRVKRSLQGLPPIDVVAAVDAEWDRLGLDAALGAPNAGKAKGAAGKRIAIGVGSRGITDLQPMVRRVVERVKAAGASPFIVPAMGSHGGATAEGQLEVLASLGITEADMGCPLEATMDTVVLGATAAGLPAHFDALAAAADGVMLVNRVKMHTSFHGPLESGLHKMLAIGMGKERAATLLHSRGPDGLRDDMPQVARVLLAKVPFLAGFGVVEDGTHRPVALKGLSAAELEAGERELLELARSLAPGLPFADVDVLMVEHMGKNISGTGMDTNVIGRLRIPGKPEPDSPRVKAIVVCDLTEATHGNALGMGLADIALRRLADKVDFALTARNVLASGFLERGRMPLVLADEAEAMRAAIDHVFRDRPEGKAGARVVGIRSTLDLQEFLVSENLAGEARKLPGYLGDSGPGEFGTL
ncbi:MAG TPA: DUF2088 domain-containing protein [Fibrobacteria bacterium]|nr:DUF2088 domain-containing protein [Fibrobacteria bacterium]